MAAVIQLESFRKQRETDLAKAHLHNLAALRPVTPGDALVSDAEIWTRDYASLQGMLQGLVAVRRILDHHLHFAEEWKFHLLDVLESLAAAHAKPVSPVSPVSPASPGEPAVPGTVPGTRPVAETVAQLKQCLVEDMTVANRGDLLRALLMLDLLEGGAREARKLAEKDAKARRMQ